MVLIFYAYWIFNWKLSSRNVCISLATTVDMIFTVLSPLATDRKELFYGEASSRREHQHDAIFVLWTPLNPTERWKWRGKSDGLGHQLQTSLHNKNAEVHFEKMEAKITNIVIVFLSAPHESHAESERAAPTRDVSSRAPSNVVCAPSSCSPFSLVVDIFIHIEMEHTSFLSYYLFPRKRKIWWCILMVASQIW